MYPSVLSIRCQGMITTPIPAVTIAPIRKPVWRGAKFMIALAGATTLAAMLVERVAMVKAKSEMTTANPPPIRPAKTVGSGIASPKITTVADVTATPMKAKRVMNRGKPIAWPSIWSF